MLIARRALPVVAVLLAAAGCTGNKPDAKPLPTTAAPAHASASPSPSAAVAVTLDDAARRGCQLLIHTKADTGDASPDDPTLQQVADLLATSRHFSLRFDGQQLGLKLAAYRAAKGTDMETTASAAVTQAAKALDASCTANGAYKPQG